ncbi:MAG: dehydrogenase [Fimbriimonadales bacterium]
MAKETVVVVGAGGISGAWFPRLIEEGVGVLAVVEIDPKVAQKALRRHGLRAEVSTDLKATLRKHRPSFVLDLTTPDAHAKVTTTALRAGCHVLGEKPMAASMSEARRMVRTSEQTGRMYMVAQTRRWDPRHASLREGLRRGLIGDVTTVNCDFYMGAHFGGFREQMQSPLILDMAIHQFDLARFFTGADPVAVYAHEFNPKGSWYKGDVAATCVFEMTDGIVFTYRGSWCAEGCPTSWNGDWRVIGTKGTMLYEANADPVGEVALPGSGFERKRKAVHPPKVVVKYEGFHGALSEMLTYLRKGTLPQTECHDNIKSLAMVFAAIESAKRKRRIPIRAL